VGVAGWIESMARRWSSASPTQPSTTVRLLANAGHPTAEITLFDRNFAAVAQAVGVLDVKVAPGLYELQYKAGRSVQEQTVRVPAGTAEFSVPVPQLSTHTTAVPLRTTDDGRKLTRWVSDVSHKVHAAPGQGSELFILSRLLGKEDPATHAGIFDLQVKDSNGQVVADFGKNATWYEEGAAARAYTIAVAPGTYVLSAAAGSLGRLEQTVHAAAGWQTQVLLTPTEYGAERVKGADLRKGAVLMSLHGRGCNVDASAVDWVEAAKVALFARTPAAPVDALRRAVDDARSVPQSDAASVNELLAAKFTNPMLGILGGHLLLLQKKVDLGLLKEVVQNLERLVPGHPDVQALRYAAGWQGDATFPMPPMLRSSWQLIIDESIEHPEIIPMDSYSARIATRTWGGGAWLVWKAPPAETKPARAAAPMASRSISPPSALDSGRQMQEVIDKLEKMLPRHDVDRYVATLARRLDLDASETRVLRYLASAARQTQLAPELVPAQPANFQWLYSAAYGWATGRHLPDAKQVLDWVKDARDQYLRDSSMVKALGIPKSTVTTAVDRLSTLLKGDVLMAPKVCFDRILPKDLNKVRPAAPIPGARTRAAFEIAKLWDLGKTLRVRFMSGTQEQKDIVKQFAPQWCEHANIKFVFSNDQNAEIRIAFDENDGAWSYIGTDCADIPISQPTMNLGWQDEGVVLHEFGHAIGLIHEHQNPVGGIQWNKPAVIADLSGPPNSWDPATIEHNMFETYAQDQINGTALDKLSIMLYAIPKAWTTNGFSSKPNEKLSETDKKFAHNQCNYPFEGPRKQPCT
jgi:hypothetical protein